MIGVKRLARFAYEALHLKRVARSGWWVAGVDLPESVAEHAFGAAFFAWILSRMEGADAEKAVLMAVLHDVPEARINDLHKVAQRYLDVKAAQARVVAHQAESLPAPFGGEYKRLHEEMEARESLEARVLKDADLLECLAQARFYEQRGYPVGEWIVNSEKGLLTESGRALARALKDMPPRAWYEGLKANVPHADN